MNDIRQLKQACLLAEHDALSRYVEQELVAVALLRGLAAVAWSIAMSSGASHGSSQAVAALAPLAALWLADVFFTYVGVIYKARRLKVRQWIEELPSASEKTLAAWCTPANPFDGLTRAEKIAALRDALTSPAVVLVYAVLASATAVITLAA